jgi:gamma-glutamylcyclotransferase (GGCT)/AIG2-like uncharacterized protein YtfP
VRRQIISDANERLFSYGTLQLKKVQIETFGRSLNGHKDMVTGYIKNMLEITDEAVVATSEERYHPIIKYTGIVTDSVEGTVLMITPEELAQADEYEVDDYKRVSVTTISGLSVWLYMAAG